MTQEVATTSPQLPSLKKIPVSKCLMQVNVAIHLLRIFMPILIVLLSLLQNQRQLNNATIKLASQLATNLQEYWLYLGALVTRNVPEGEWWRVLTANFLHADLVHLLSNMLGLYILGGILEPILGRTRYIIGYFSCGIGSMILLTILSNLQLIRETYVVGASGAIMGLLGITGTIFLIRWQRWREPIAAQRLKMVGLIVVFQVIFDYFNPQNTMAGHLSGLGLGLIIGLLIVKTLPKTSLQAG